MRNIRPLLQADLQLLLRLVIKTKVDVDPGEVEARPQQAGVEIERLPQFRLGLREHGDGALREIRLAEQHVRGSGPRIRGQDGLAFADRLLGLALLQVFGRRLELRRIPRACRVGGLPSQRDDLGPRQREEYDECEARRHGQIIQ